MSLDDQLIDMEKKKWYENEEDLATKEVFNYGWFAIFIFALIIGVKSHQYSNYWGGFVLAIGASLALIMQQVWEWEMILHFKKENKQLKQLLSADVKEFCTNRKDFSDRCDYIKRCMIVYRANNGMINSIPVIGDKKQ